MRLPIAILVDVDGTLVSPYRQGRRELRPSAPAVLAMLADVAPVFLWSIVGADNGERLLNEFPELRPLVRGSYGKANFPLDSVDRAFAIDDELLDDPVLRCRHFLLDTSYYGGEDEGDLRQIALAIVAEIQRAE